MWNAVKRVAQNRRIIPEKLVEYAVQNESKFGIIIEAGGPSVNTWYCNDLVNAFKQAHPEACNQPYPSIPSLTTIIHHPKA